MKTLLITFLFLCTALTAMQASAATCESLADLKLTNTTIVLAQSVPTGAFALPPSSIPPLRPGSADFSKLPAFCRVRGTIRPSSDSNIQFEVWLPAAAWNGKYQGVGNGGFAGEISYDAMAGAVAAHYATASTDTGHRGTSIDARWALGHSEKIVDFGYRAIHETTVTAKAIIRAFYGSSPTRSYFSSCSNGGRQALMEAQRYPEDYDGIIAGAPANFLTHLVSVMAWNMQAISAGPSYIGPNKLAAIQEAVKTECDMLDGVKDGVLEKPAQCAFNPSKLLCSGSETDRCLTNSQLVALSKIYGGPQNAKGEQAFPGFLPGGEADGWDMWITGKETYTQAAQFAFGTQFFQNMVYNDPNWDIKTFNWERDTKVADDKMAGILNATDPDLSNFKKRGGKLILYHGWNDAAIPALNSVNYYQSVASRMGQKETDEFVRLFIAPGMGHCIGGTGPDSFGQFDFSQSDPEHNINAAMERWVERRVGPDKIIAVKYKAPDTPTGILRTRPLCPYPKVAKYKGSGSTDDAVNFTCADQ